MYNACMPNVQIREVPEDVHNELVRRAELAGQSLQQYLSAQLTAMVATPTIDDDDRPDRAPIEGPAVREPMRSPRSRTNVLVVDASVIAPAVADGGPDGEACRARIKGQSLAAPDLLRVEAVSVIRRQLANGALTASTSEPMRSMTC